MIAEAGSQAGGSRQATNFKVVVTVDEPIPNVRPGFSCTADITTATRKNVASVPIQAMTIRERLVEGSRTSDTVAAALNRDVEGIAATGPVLLNSDGDLPRHLLVGSLIRAAHNVDLVDVFSFRTTGYPSIPHEWLSQVILSLFNDAMGLGGVVLFTALIITITWAIIYYETLRRSGSLILALAFTGLHDNTEIHDLISRLDDVLDVGRHHSAHRTGRRLHADRRGCRAAGRSPVQQL